MNSADQAEDAEQSEAAGQSDLGDSNGGAALEELLAHIRQTRNLDFTGYKRAQPVRRIEKRMQAVGVAGYAEYQRLPRGRTPTSSALFDTILINVTGFFRDPSGVGLRRRRGRPPDRRREGRDEPIRVWSAGCASGEEAYSSRCCWPRRSGEDAFRDAGEDLRAPTSTRRR